MSWQGKFEELFEDCRANYVRIFDLLYPAKNSTGFTERNLSVNFAKAYEAMHPSAITWYEFQFGPRNDLHYDAVIIDPVEKEILLIESKRFSNPPSKVREIEDDIRRINRPAADHRKDFLDRMEGFSDYTMFGVILADVWAKPKGRTKRKILESFQDQSFLDTFCSGLSPEDRQCLIDSICFARGFPDVTYSPSIQEQYHILALIWKLTAEA